MSDDAPQTPIPAFDRSQLVCPVCASRWFEWERITPFRDGISSAFLGILSETLELDMATCTACRHVVWFRA